MTELANIHPGDVLLEELLKLMGIGVPRFADEIGLSLDSVSQLIAGRRSLELANARRFRITSGPLGRASARLRGRG